MCLHVGLYVSCVLYCLLCTCFVIRVPMCMSMCLSERTVCWVYVRVDLVHVSCVVCMFVYVSACVLCTLCMDVNIMCIACIVWALCV